MDTIEHKATPTVPIMSYKLVVPATRTKPKTQSTRTSDFEGLLQILGTNFSIVTILLVGACLQTLIVLTVRDYRYALLPAFIALSLRLINSILIAYNIKQNPYMEGVFPGRASTIMPDEEGTIDSDKRQKVAILLLGAKTNHPFGIFGSQFTELFNWFKKMDVEFNAERAPKGFLGQTSFNRKDERGALEFSMISYWRSIEDLHAYAHGPLHREAWLWWEKTLKQNDCVGINHEIFEAPPGHWENVYVNFQPTGLGSTSVLKKGDKLEGGVIDDEWIAPLVDVRKGKLSKSSARLGRDQTKYDVDRPFGEMYG